LLVLGALSTSLQSGSGRNDIAAFLFYTKLEGVIRKNIQKENENKKAD